jgi:hypothetical protein
VPTSRCRRRRRLSAARPASRSASTSSTPFLLGRFLPPLGQKLSFSSFTWERPHAEHRARVAPSDVALICAPGRLPRAHQPRRPTASSRSPFAAQRARRGRAGEDSAGECARGPARWPRRRDAEGGGLLLRVRVRVLSACPFYGPALVLMRRSQDVVVTILLLVGVKSRSSAARRTL